jgi:alpha-beta hydrolase superfamily lysophospholipase
MLDGGLGHSGNWGYQVPALADSGYRAVLIDSRGHGDSTRDERPYTYELRASDVLAVMDHLQLERQPLWVERRRMHRFGPRQECRPPDCRCLLLCLQDGSQRFKGYRAQPGT